MTEPDDVPDSDDLATKSLRRLRKAEKEHELTKRRLKRFPLFEDTEYEDYKGDIRKVPKARFKADDSPTLQMILARRDRYESCVRQIARAEAVLERAEPGTDEYAEVLRSLVYLEQTADRHAKAMEQALASLSVNDKAVQGTRANLLTSMAKMAQAERFHADRLEIARKTNPANMADAELMRIANGEEAEADGRSDP